MSAHFLQKQREEQKFRHAIDTVKESSGSLKKLTASELGHLNQLLTTTEKDPWRQRSVELKLPDGGTHHFNMISNPFVRARDILGQAFEIANNKNVEDAAVYLYTQLVLEHLFNDANRRTAALAALWLVSENGRGLDSQKLLDIPLGNLRDKTVFSEFDKKMRPLIEKK